MPSDDLNLLALVKGTERYVFLYEDGCESALMDRLGRFASNPELSFTRYDATVCSQRVRQARQRTRLTADRHPRKD